MNLAFKKLSLSANLLKQIAAKKDGGHLLRKSSIFSAVVQRNERSNKWLL
jgi:hypothetical protein